MPGEQGDAGRLSRIHEQALGAREVPGHETDGDPASRTGLGGATERKRLAAAVGQQHRDGIADADPELLGTARVQGYLITGRSRPFGDLGGGEFRLGHPGTPERAPGAEAPLVLSQRLAVRVQNDDVGH